MTASADLLFNTREQNAQKYQYKASQPTTSTLGDRSGRARSSRARPDDDVNDLGVRDGLGDEVTAPSRGQPCQCISSSEDTPSHRGARSRQELGTGESP
eukprot:gene22596-30864_t